MIFEHAIGPTFPAELAAANLRDGILWTLGPNGSVYCADDFAQLAALQAVIAAHDPTKQPAPVPPDCPSLAYWLTALRLWTRADGNTAYADIQASINALLASPDAATMHLGVLAQQQFTASPGVTRADLMKIAPAFNFAPADVDESLYRADRIAQGDLSGVWPLPAASAT